MVLGRQGLWLEGWKFGLYLLVPIVASVAFNDPDRRLYWADYFQFLKYPSNPNTNMKEQWETFQRQQELEKQQREEYRAQLESLQERAKQSRLRMEEEKSKKGWFTW
mmetsp:Transcript_22374/g.51600  ORF Transcript_22374/g.51600 Transcript_22374/m.51600 type:complete len:107 (-) Transcript_22374:75-395(-)|eukprot:CAMPEP_0116835690 /NCGR_PEP_ID=MMETSP0418-20121206/7684_1 /TAXON_ID=1158023 /ORGANISM="Astrosyne radiata, Strain 13vi08-1A" /LENGTH=106 /DNA_ID=CAMNT_0004465383 /DNA_START=136 /DNA_END=456 /DNA_ORIENTATION=+